MEIQVHNDGPLRRGYTVNLGKISKRDTLIPSFKLATRLSALDGINNPVVGGGLKPNGSFLLTIVLSVTRSQDWERIEPKVKNLIEENFSSIAASRP